MKRVMLLGIGGYGNVYAEEIRRCQGEGRLRLEAAVDPRPEGCAHLPWLREEGIPVHASLEECLAGGHRADLAIVSTPSHTHEALACQLLRAGIPVLCEKPLAPTVEGAARIVEAQAASATFAAIGFQLCFSEAIRAAKRLVQAGSLGAPRRMRSLVCWPRPASYYTKNDYAGRIRDSRGAIVLDSPAANAMAHFVHNMFFLLGREPGGCAWPASIRAEAFRAYDIENHDTVAFRGTMDCGAEFLFLGSHVTPASREPLLEYEFEEGTLRCDLAAGPGLSLWRPDGSVHQLGAIAEHPHRGYFTKMHDCLERRPGWENPAPVESALPHVHTVEAIQRSLQGIVPFPGEWIEQRHAAGEAWRCVPALLGGLSRCFEQWRLPSESGLFPFALAGTPVEVQGAGAAT